MDLNVEYTITPNDLRALSRYLSGLSWQRSRNLWFNRYGKPLLVFAVFAGLAWFEQSLFLLSIGLIGGGFCFFVGPMTMKSIAIQQYMTVFSEDSFGKFGGDRKLAVNDDGITISSLDWSTRFEWSAIKKLLIDDQHAFLHHTEFNAIVIPRAQVGEEEFIFITDAIQARIQRHHPNHSFQADPDPRERGSGPLNSHR